MGLLQRPETAATSRGTVRRELSGPDERKADLPLWQPLPSLQIAMPARSYDIDVTK